MEALVTVSLHRDAIETVIQAITDVNVAAAGNPTKTGTRTLAILEEATMVTTTGPRTSVLEALCAIVPSL